MKLVMKAAMTMAACAMAGTCLGQHQGDVLLSVVDGRITTGIVREDGTIEREARVFLARFGEEFPEFTDEPGFDSEPGTFPPVGGVAARVGFRFQRAARVWDGAGFSVIPEERIEAAFGSLGPVATPEVDEVVEGFTISAGANGQWHRHLEYTITGTEGVVDAGVYLVEMTVFCLSPGIEESLPFWIVYDENAAAGEAEDAAAWVVANKVGCAADFNGDGFLDFFDYDAYVACFETGACGERSGDFNGDGFVDFFDYDAFVEGFERGC